jgi:protein gp37
MKLENTIGWCDATGNKVIGCAKVSSGCANCYAESGTVARVMRARGVETWGKHGRRIAIADFSAKLRRLNRLCICDTCHTTYPAEFLSRPNSHCTTPGGDFCGVFRRIRFFADSNSDWLDEAWPLDTLAEFLREIVKAANLDVLLLTKRPENFHDRLRDVWAGRAMDDDTKGIALAWSNGAPAWEGKYDVPANVWLGVSVENQEMADRRRNAFREIPARLKFVSFEPALSAVDWSGWGFIHWLIVGGESGKHRRDCGSLAIANCALSFRAAGVPVYVKQASAYKPGQQGMIADAVFGMKEFPKR